MRSVQGELVLPDAVQEPHADRVLIEVRDVSLADAPSTVVASTVLEDVPLTPQGVIEFELDAPDAEPGHTLALSVHVDIDGSGAIGAGDLITTVHVPVPASGPVGDVSVPLTQL